MEEASEGASGWGPPGKDPDLPDKDSGGYDEEGGDSKAIKLTLMEEVLLLGLKDREVLLLAFERANQLCLCQHTYKQLARTHTRTHPGLHIILE